jgi:hypothetical protein
MKNEALRKYSHEHLTPTEEERELISGIYSAVCEILGEHRCRQIGSYPRYTAIRPPHDLDILFRAGFSRELSPDPATAVGEIAKLLKEKFVAPNGLTGTIRVQSHSVSITLFRGTEEKFGVDIVPAWETGEQNEFDDDVFRVPELILRGHARRQRKYQRVAEGTDTIKFILTDPFGYIGVAKQVNDNNPDFRRSTKCGKGWKYVSCESNENFKFKSFHLEQIMLGYFQSNPSLEIYDALVKFFEEIPNWISHSQIEDRANRYGANPPRMIDAYVDDLSDGERSAILASRDDMLDRLRRFDGSGNVAALFETQNPSRSAASSSAGKAPAIITSTVSPRAPYGE